MTLLAVLIGGPILLFLCLALVMVIAGQGLGSDLLRRHRRAKFIAGWSDHQEDD